MNSNKLFNALFLVFSFAVIAVASGNIKLSDAALTQTNAISTENEVVYEQEYALDHNLSKAVYQHKI